MYTGTQRKYAAQLVVFIELGYDGIRLYGHLHPGGKKAAFYGIPYRADIGPCGAVKWNLIPLKDLTGKSAGECTGDFVPSIFLSHSTMLYYLLGIYYLQPHSKVLFHTFYWHKKISSSIHSSTIQLIQHY